MSKVVTVMGVMTSFRNVICVGCFKLQALLRSEKQYGHTEVNDNWGADVYAFGDTAIVTGRVPFGNIVPSNECVDAIEKQAENLYQELYSNNKRIYVLKMKLLIKCFIDEVKGNVYDQQENSNKTD